MDINDFMRNELTRRANIADQVGRRPINESLVHCAAFVMAKGLDTNKPFITPDNWWHPTTDVAPIKSQLIEKIVEGDMVGVMNLAAIIWAKEQLALAKLPKPSAITQKTAVTRSTDTTKQSA